MSSQGNGNRLLSYVLRKAFIWYLFTALGIPMLLLGLQSLLSQPSMKFNLIVVSAVLVSSVIGFRYWGDKIDWTNVSQDKRRRVFSLPYLVLWLVPPVSWILVLGWSPAADSFTSIWRAVLSVNSKLIFAVSIWSAVVLIIWVRARKLILLLLLVWLAPVIFFLIAMKWVFKSSSDWLVVLLTLGWSAAIFCWWTFELKSEKENKKRVELGKYAWLPFCLLFVLPPIALITTKWPIDTQDPTTVVLFTISWATAVFCLWVGLGDGPVHESNFARYKSIWIVFASILLITLLGNYTSYSIVETRVNSLQGTTALLINTVKDPHEGLEVWAQFGYGRARSLREDLRKANSPQDGIRTLETYQLDLSDSVGKIRSNANRAKTLVNSLKPANENQQGGAPELLSYQRLANTTESLALTAISLKSSWDATKDAKELLKRGGATDLSDLRSKAAELESNYSDATRETADVKTTLDAMEVNRLAPFVLASVLFNVFLLFPWVVLFLFLFRNHEVLINEKVQLLKNLGLETGFLARSKPDYSKSDDENVAQAIRNLAFRNAEYVASLVIFTVLTATILYFFFFPHATPGLAQLIVESKGVEGFTKYLVADATPITFGFIGAYFFVINMLLRRYFASDLNPKAYTNAVGRLLTVFILGVAIQLISNLSGYPRINKQSAAIVAFVAGIFPMTALRWISRTANRIVRYLNAPEYIDQNPLTHLDGLNIWHEARFLEEKVESVQNLATAPLDDLIVHTNFSALQLMDWVDQASLFIHTQDKWTDAFHGVGIRTATNLLSATCKKEKGHYKLDSQSVADLAMAINASEMAVTSGGKQSSGEAREAISGLQKSAAEITRIAQELRELSAILDKDKPDSFDAVLLLNEKIAKLAAQIKKSQDNELKALSEKTTELPSSDDDLVSKVKEEVKKLQEAFIGLGKQAELLRVAAEKLNRTKPETLSALPDVKRDLESLIAAAGSLKERAAAVAALTEQGHDSDTDKAEWSKLLAAGKALADASEQILGEAQAVKEMADPLDKDKPETLSSIGVIQDRLDHLKKASEDLRSDTERAGTFIERVEERPRAVEEARKRIDAAADSAKELAALTGNARNAAPSATNKLPDFKKTIDKVIQAASQTMTKAQETVTAIQVVSTPTQITREIIAVMVKTIEENPNLERLQQFWKMRSQEGRRNHEDVIPKHPESAATTNRPGHGEN